jgi:hypothetical protein
MKRLKKKKKKSKNLKKFFPVFFRCPSKITKEQSETAGMDSLGRAENP